MVVCEMLVDLKRGGGPGCGAGGVVQGPRCSTVGNGMFWWGVGVGGGGGKQYLGVQTYRAN